jgi:hypothetical protein
MIELTGSKVMSLLMNFHSLHASLHPRNAMWNSIRTNQTLCGPFNFYTTKVNGHIYRQFENKLAYTEIISAERE